MAVPARVRRWDRLGFLLDGLGRVQRPHRERDPVTYVLFVVFIVLMKAATVYAMRGLKQAK